MKRFPHPNRRRSLAIVTVGTFMSTLTQRMTVTVSLNSGLV